MRGRLAVSLSPAPPSPGTYFTMKEPGREARMLILAITGMPGAGKSTAAKALEAEGFKRIVMGDVIREETRKRGLEPDAKNTGDVMLELPREVRARSGGGSVPSEAEGDEGQGRDR